MALTRAQLILLEGAGEEEFTRWVKSRAHHHGWKGIHVRYSQGVIESVHLERLDGFSEAYGMPDWLFWHEGLGQAFLAELKGVSGHLSRYQKLEIPSLRKGGLAVFVWLPRDAETVETVFREGLQQP
jgi:hypothetical protein